MQVDGSSSSSLNVAVQFNAPNANVVAAGIRFGTNGPIRTVNAADQGTSGTISFTAGIPPGLCDDLSSICHDIKCYEFAVTAAGNISQSNVASLAVMCGNCDEPSCQQFMDPEDCEEPEPSVSASCKDMIKAQESTCDQWPSSCDHCCENLFDCLYDTDCDTGVCMDPYQSCIGNCSF